MTQDPHRNNRVSTREYFAELQKLRAEQKADFKEVRQDQSDMERRILKRIDDVSESYATKDDVADLRKRIRNSDVVLAMGVVFATTIGAIFGRK